MSRSATILWGLGIKGSIKFHPKEWDSRGCTFVHLKKKVLRKKLSRLLEEPAFDELCPLPLSSVVTAASPSSSFTIISLLVRWKMAPPYGLRDLLFLPTFIFLEYEQEEVRRDGEGWTIMLHVSRAESAGRWRTTTFTLPVSSPRPSLRVIRLLQLVKLSGDELRWIIFGFPADCVAAAIDFCSGGAVGTRKGEVKRFFMEVELLVAGTRETGWFTRSKRLHSEAD